MTIAAGFFCNDGIVLAADSQETLGGYSKEYRGKIHTIVFRKSVVAFAGAGWSDYIDTAIEKAAAGLGDCNDLEEIRTILERNLLDFFAGHLADWAAFPENERPSVELLVGVTTATGPFGLFHYSGTAFHRTSQKAIGTGVILANNLISEYSFGVETLEELGTLAVYILSKVKKRVDTCGGRTDLVVLRKGGDFALTDWQRIDELQTELENEESQFVAELKRTISSKRLPKFLWMKERRRPEISGGESSSSSEQPADKKTDQNPKA